jgi:transcriptional regulator with XRE-family HTH domain
MPGSDLEAAMSGPQPARPEPVRLTLADKLNLLFDKKRPAEASEREYSNAEVARAVGVSPTHIGNLRKRPDSNPSAELLRDLARFFGVKPSFLLDDDPVHDHGVVAQVKLAALLENERVHVLAMRLLDANPSAAALDAITNMVEEVLRLEGRTRPPRGRRTDSQ